MATRKNNTKTRGRSLFGTATFWGIILTLLIATKAPVEEALQKKVFDPTDYWNVLQAIAAALIIIVDRYNNDSCIYTPHGVPGRNKETVQSNEPTDNNLE